MRTCERQADYYAVLEVQPTASVEVIHAVYRVLIRSCHPDVVPVGQRAAATRRAQQLNEAKAVLLDADARAEYDWCRLDVEEVRVPDAPPESWMPEPVAQETTTVSAGQSPQGQETVAEAPRSRAGTFASGLLRYAGYFLLGWFVLWFLSFGAYLLLWLALHA